ncbi:hypothetical protein THRCLA_09912, partial [Thraustotheca clavata]
CLDGVDEIYGYHNGPFPLGVVAVKGGPMLAHACFFSITVKGPGGHGSAPHQTQDPIVAAGQIIVAIQSIASRNISAQESAVISITQVHGGEADNVIPSSVKMSGTIRDFSPQVFSVVEERMRSIVENTAKAYGVIGTVEFKDSYPVTVNTQPQADIVAEVVSAAYGPQKVISAGLPVSGSEDFSYYLQKIPGAFYFVGTKESVSDASCAQNRNLHSDTFDFNDAALPVTVRTFLEIAQHRFGVEFTNLTSIPVIIRSYVVFGLAKMASITEVDATELTYEEFCDQYMSKNEPVLIKNIGKDWKVFDWCTPENELQYNELKSKYGTTKAPVVEYSKKSEYGEELRYEIEVGKYLDLLESGQAEKDQIYLKDWHFTRDFPHDVIYTTPEYFRDDWLNWWWDCKAKKYTAKEPLDDYRFVYLGPRGSFTPLHHDVFESNRYTYCYALLKLEFSWSINIIGEKEWIFFAPSEVHKLRDQFGRTVLTNALDYDSSKYPLASTATPIRLIQPPRSAILVPSGWYHQVTNTKTTLSINHNWFNAYNIEIVWKYFQRELQAVEKEIAHCRDSFDTEDEWIAQLILRANIGMDFNEFRELLQAKALDTNATEFDSIQINKILNELCVD